MKISVQICPGAADPEIVITCGKLTPEIERILAALRILDWQIMVTKENESYILSVSEIIYLESVDRKTFVYTAGNCFESKLRLYEVEAQLCPGGFARVSKSCLVNMKFIRSLKSELNHRLRLTLENGEQLIVSRVYADELKRRLGVK